MIMKNPHELEELALQVSHLIQFICSRVLQWLSALIYLALKLSCGSSLPYLLLLMVYWADAYTDSCQTSEIELFVKIVSNWKLLTFFSKKKKKNSILDVWQGSEYASAE